MGGSKEFSATAKAEELADILEVLKGIAANQGVGWEEIVKLANAKAAERGGFSKRIILERVEE